MTNELEKQFFDTFGIEPITQAVWDSTETKWKNFESWEEYPQITDRILLELVCIAMDITDFGASNVKDLKEIVLNILCDYKDKVIKHQIQALFKEG